HGAIQIALGGGFDDILHRQRGHAFAAPKIAQQEFCAIEPAHVNPSSHVGPAVMPASRAPPPAFFLFTAGGPHRPPRRAPASPPPAQPPPNPKKKKKGGGAAPARGGGGGSPGRPHPRVLPPERHTVRA